MNFDFFLKFTKFRLGSLVAAEDFADKYNYQFTTAVILVFIMVVGMRQYVFTPIQCFIPHEFSKSWEEYAENYCWVQDTYSTDTKDGKPPSKVDMGSRLRISYYQWVPFVLGLQCLLFYTPHIVWKILSTQLGTNINQLVRFAAECSTVDQDKKTKMIRYLAKELQKLMDAKREYRSKGIKLRLRRWLPCLWFGKRSGVYLVLLYFAVKKLYIVNCFLQLSIMRHFLGAKDLAFGLTLLSNLLQGRTWEHSGYFPRVAWCDLQRYTVGTNIMHSIPCVLPVNMLNEKIYIFLWFWIVFGIIIIVFSMILWMTRMFITKNRRIFVKKYLIMLDSIKEGERRLAHMFINNFLRHDGVFLLRMIANNAGELVAAEVIAEVWRMWKKYRLDPLSKISPEPEVEQRRPVPRNPLLPSAPPTNTNGGRTVHYRPSYTGDESRPESGVDIV